VAADPTIATSPVGVFVEGARALFGLAKNKRTPNVVEIAKRSGDWNDVRALEVLERKLTGPGTGARTPGGQIALDKSRAFLRNQVTTRLAELEPGPGEPEPELEEPELEEPELEEPLPGDDEYTDEEEAEDEYYADLENEIAFADDAFDPTEQEGDPERRRVERELRNQNVAPYATEYYRGQFVDDRPRVPDRVPTRVPGRVGQAGAIVEGIVGLIRIGKQLWELQTEDLPLPKGSKTRPKGRTRTRQPELEEIRVSKARKPAVRVDETTRRALEKRVETKRAPELELEEIRVTKQRRMAPTRTAAPPGTRTRTPTIVDLRSLGLLYDLVKSRPKSRTLVRERIITQPGAPELPPTVPEVITKPPTRSPELPPQRDRDRVEQTLTQQQQTGTRTREKKCVKEKENRTVCYKGFYRERKQSTAKKRWTRIDCITGKEL